MSTSLGTTACLSCVEDSVEAGYGFEEKPRLKEINK